MDTFRALSVVGLGDRETVRATLRASMVKRTIDIPAFEQLFALFFSGLADAIAEATAATRGALGLDDPDFQRLLEELERLLRERGIELSPRVRCSPPTGAASSACCARPASGRASATSSRGSRKGASRTPSPVRSGSER